MKKNKENQELRNLIQSDSNVLDAVVTLVSEVAEFIDNVGYQAGSEILGLYNALISAQAVAESNSDAKIQDELEYTKEYMSALLFNIRSVQDLIHAGAYNIHRIELIRERRKTQV